MAKLLLIAFGMGWQFVSLIETEFQRLYEKGVRIHGVTRAPPQLIFDKKMNYIERYLRLSDDLHSVELSAGIVHSYIRENIERFEHEKSDDYIDYNKIGFAYHIIRGCELYDKLGDNQKFIDLYTYLFRLNIMEELEFETITRYDEKTLKMHGKMDISPIYSMEKITA